MDEQSVNHCQNSQGEQGPLTGETVSPGSERLSVTRLHQHLGKFVQYYLPIINLEENSSSFKSLCMQTRVLVHVMVWEGCACLCKRPDEDV